jgi:hypothetical protein
MAQRPGGRCVCWTTAGEVAVVLSNIDPGAYRVLEVRDRGPVELEVPEGGVTRDQAALIADALEAQPSSQRGYVSPLGHPFQNFGTARERQCPDRGVG